MMDFILIRGEGILTILIIFIIIIFPYSRFIKPTDYNSEGMYEEGYNKAEFLIMSGIDPEKLLQECQGGDKWDSGWTTACNNYIN